MVSVSHTFPTGPGNSKGHQNCSQWEGKCIECAKSIKWTQGIFCVNWCISRGGFVPCRYITCGKCFTLDEKVKFSIQKRLYVAENKESKRDQQRLENAWKSKHRKDNDFLHARNGDHLLILFECPKCLFRKRNHRDQELKNPQDELLMACIIRAILDAFWSRAEGTVSGYARNARKMSEHSETAWLYGLFRHSAQLPWEDHCGCEVAVEMLLYSRKEGKWQGLHAV